MSDNVSAEEPQEAQEQFEVSSEQVTGLGTNAQLPVFFKRKRLLIVVCVSLCGIIGGGLIINILKPEPGKTASENESLAGNTSPDVFLSTLQNRALNNLRSQILEETETEEIQPDPQPLLPEVTVITRTHEEERPARQTPAPPSQAPPPPQNTQQQEPAHFRSSLVPPIQGTLFSQGIQSNLQLSSAASGHGDSYSTFAANQQVAAEAGQSFYDSSNTGGIIYNGRYLGDNSIWTGTIITGILETAINTDLPGNVLARVTQNIYDSQTGKNLLIPQGTLLIARYNSSVSYAQHRIQIVWDTMIRPDGFQLDLDGANGVDRSGMSGQPAKYDENFFEYLKAAGIITLFSITNANMTETAAKYATAQSASNIAESNSQLVNQLGGSLIARAMNIQPTLTVANGTVINIMLNRTLYLPPVEDFPAVKKYILR